LNVFGVDSPYFVTIKNLLIRPETVFKNYLNGARGDFVRPLTFFMFGAAVSNQPSPMAVRRL